MLNIRDKGAAIWEKWNRPQRVTFALVMIFFVALLPYAGEFPLTSFLNTQLPLTKLLWFTQWQCLFSWHLA